MTMTKTPFRPQSPQAAGNSGQSGYSDGSGFPYPNPPRRRAGFLIFLTTTVLTLMALIIIYALFFRDGDTSHQKPKEKPVVESTDEPMDIDSGEQWMEGSDGNAVRLNIPGDGGGPVIPTEESTSDTATIDDTKGGVPSTSTNNRLPVDDPPVMDEQPITSLEAEAQKRAAAAAKAKQTPKKAPTKPTLAPGGGAPIPPPPVIDQP